MCKVLCWRLCICIPLLSKQWGRCFYYPHFPDEETEGLSILSRVMYLVRFRAKIWTPVVRCHSPHSVTLPYIPLYVCVYMYLNYGVKKYANSEETETSFSADETLTSGCSVTEHANNSFQEEVSVLGLSHWTMNHSKGAQGLWESGGS